MTTRAFDEELAQVLAMAQLQALAEKTSRPDPNSLPPHEGGPLGADYANPAHPDYDPNWDDWGCNDDCGCRD